MDAFDLIPRSDSNGWGAPQSRIGFTEGTVTDSTGAHVATATSTLLISELPA
jgi:hypothetical protein